MMTNLMMCNKVENVLNNLELEEDLLVQLYKIKKYLSATEEQTLKYIHELPANIIFPIEVLDNAFEYFNKKRLGRLDEACTYGNYKRWLKSLLESAFFEDSSIKVDIADMCRCGWCPSYGYSLSLDLSIDNKKKNMSIRIPLLENITKEFRSIAYNGKYVLSVRDRYKEEILLTTYHINEITDYIKWYMEE